MSNQYPTSEGGLWPNKHKTEKRHPDNKGEITVTDDQLRELINMRKQGKEAKLQLGSWDRVAKQSGAPYIFLSAQVYNPPQQQQPAPQQYQQPPAQQPAPPQNPAPAQPQPAQTGFIDSDPSDIPW